MSGLPPPKDGEVVTSSTKLETIRRNAQKVANDIAEILEDAGYGNGKASE